MNMQNLAFKLEDVSVRFRRNEVLHRSLKHGLSQFMHRRTGEEFHALSNISLEIRDGDHIGIVGRNGAGKSTLLRVLTRVIEPQEGSVYTNGFKHVVPLLELGIGFHPDLSGRENCFLAGHLMGYSRTEIREKIPDIIRFSELGEFFNQPVKTFSSGMYARLAFALATDIVPDVLLVDEVFGVGDEFFIRKCVVRMQRLMSAGTTTVLVSHNIDFLVQQCNRLVWLDNGRIVMDGEPQDVALEYRQQNGKAA